MHCGGTTPRRTFEVLLEEFPGLCRPFNKEGVIAQCELIQKAEIPDQSKRFQNLFHDFNLRYFDGRLPPYKVHVVFDVNFWSNEYYFDGWGVEEFSQGFHDHKNRRIFLRQGAYRMEGMLLHEMAHAATTEDHDQVWRTEMNRLQALGAPVDPCDL